MPDIKIRRKVKDTVFTDLFGDPKYLLQLYQTLHPEDTATTQEGLKYVTLEPVIVDGIYNDLGFMVNNRLMVLVEAQSTWTVNIIIRSLLYLAQSYKEYFVENDINLYSSKKAPMPEPELYVIYTGERSNRPEYITLSEEFFGGKSTALDVRVKMLYGEDKADIVGQYVRFCKVFNMVVSRMGYTEEAILEVIRICRDEEILTEYLATREKEAFSIMFTLFDEEYITRAWQKEWKEEILAEGMEKGRQEGRQEGRLEGRQEGKQSLLDQLLKMGIITPQQAQQFV